MTCISELEISAVFRRLLDNSEELAYYAIAEILEVVNNPNLNKNRGSTVWGDRWFKLHVIEY